MSIVTRVARRSPAPAPAPVVSVAAVDTARPPPLDLLQGVRILAGLALIGWALAWWSDTGSSPADPPMTLFCLVVGLVVIGLGATSRSGPGGGLDRRIFILTLVVTGMWLGVRSTAHVYGTDELTTGQASAAALIAGHNPYATDLRGQLRAFDLPSQVSTPLLDGGTVHGTSYPALSFLLYVPLGLLLGLQGHFALVTDGLAWVLLMVLLWRLMQPRLRPLLPLITAFPYFLAFIDGGVTDVIYLPFLVVALHLWERHLDRGRSRAVRWAGPVALGLACSVKPLPWLVAPFLVAAVSVEASRRHRSPWRAGAGYAAVAAGAFLAVNMPFIVMDPVAWVHGTLLPVAQPLVPFGQGIAMLPLYLHMAGGHVGYLSIAALAAVVGCLGAFIAFYPRTVRLLPLMAVAPLLLSPRSLFNYFMYAPILVLVTAASAPRHHRDERRLFTWGGRALGVAGAVATVAATAAFLASPAPLRLTIAGETTVSADVIGGSSRSAASPGRPSTVTVLAENLSDAPVKPTFLITVGGSMYPAWRAEGGPAVLLAHAQATYVLVNTDRRSELAAGTTYLVDALATNPGSVSTSPWRTAPGAGESIAP